MIPQADPFSSVSNYQRVSNYQLPKRAVIILVSKNPLQREYRIPATDPRIVQLVGLLGVQQLPSAGSHSWFWTFLYWAVVVILIGGK